MIIGHHISKQDLINPPLFNCYQFFASSPKSWVGAANVNNEETDRIKEWKKIHSVFLVIHGKYLYNFCRTTEQQFNTLENELRYASKIDNDVDVVIHQGKNIKELGLTRAEAIDTFCDGITRILYNTRDLKNKIILENSAHQGTEIGYSLEELSIIYNKINSNRIGICIDLCHVFVAGELDMRDNNLVKLYFKKFDSLIGLSKLSLIHYNDSSSKFNSHNDCHGDIGNGYIGNTSLGGNSSGFSVITKIANKYKIPMVLETPGSCFSYSDQIREIKKMH